METQTKVCQNCKKNFTIESDDFGFYEKINVPPPTFCPECRSQRRLTWRNNTSLYNRVCDLCKKSVVTIYSKESGIIVYCNKCWWSDKWDPKSYGQDYDFSKTFFQQFKELSLKVPHMAMINDDGIGSVNCEYTQDFAFGKNCYMVFVAWHIENVMYSYFMLSGKDMVDCLNIATEANLMYECTQCGSSYQLQYSHFCKACVDSCFLYDCKNCTNCFLCIGLVNKKYCFKNKEYLKEEYEKILKSYSLNTFSGIEKTKKEFDNFILSYPRRYNIVLKSTNCDGNNIFHSKNTHRCFMVRKCENCKYCDLLADVKDSYDITGGGELSESYEGVVPDHSNRNLFGIYSWKNQDVTYTEHCHSSKSLFGCVGLRNTKYCILNTEYSKDEYEIIVKKIVKQMNDIPYVDKIKRKYGFGEFFPAELSPFAYNEAEVNERFPLSKEEITKKYWWQENIQLTRGKETLKPENIPESISDVEGDLILNEVLACISCKRNYKIVPNELIFYRKMKIPIPRRCFYCRHEARLKRRNPFKLWHRQCMCDKKNHFHGEGKCEVEFETTYAPERTEIIYCEKCYQQEVY